MSILRPYQRQALDAIWQTLSGDVNRVAVEMATGLGKTITFGAAIDEWLDQGPRWDPDLPRAIAGGSRALVLVHTDELVRQAVDKIRVVTKGRWTIGVVKAGQNEVTADIVVASVATLARPDRREQITDVGLIVVDECHHAVAQTYVDILEFFGGLPDCLHPTGASTEGHCWDCMDTGFTHPAVPVLGFTATLARTDGRGLGHVWQDLAFSRSLPWAIRHGWLVDLVPYTITIPGLDPAAGDSALDNALADSIAPEAVVETWMVKCVYGLDHGQGAENMPSTVLFAPLVRSAQAFADAFSTAGVKAEVVHGALPAAERAAILERYDSGVTTVVCNAMVLTEGWDSPRTKCVIVARPTQSVPLFVQMVGRGLRPWLASEAPPREDQRCVLLCVQGATTNLATVADLSEHIGQVIDGQSLLAMEDEWDIGQDIPDEDTAYRGPVRVEAWDALVQRSSKAWKYTESGVPFLPTARRGLGYVFAVESGGQWEVWYRREVRRPGRAATGQFQTSKLAGAPDLELAMALAEDAALEHGGDIGRLIADKGRAWRKNVPSQDMQELARRLGLGRELDRILAGRAAGKAGKLSDLIDKVTASRVLDPAAVKIRERGK